MAYFGPNMQAPGTPMYNSMSWQAPVTVVKVHGRDGANAYLLPPNSSALLLDDSNPIVWFKQTDGAGYPTVTGYNISPLQETTQLIQPQPQGDFAGLSEKVDGLSTRLTKLEKELGVGVKSDSGPVKQSK